MYLFERRTIAYLFLAGAACAVLFFPALYVFGLALAPPPPVAESRRQPPLIAAALWARIDGGRTHDLKPLGPFTVAQMAVCMVTAEGTNDNERIAQCRDVMPALRGLEHVSRLHVEDNGITRNSFRGGHSALATTVWMTRAWSADDLINTLAARGDFGDGWRGVDVAAARYFDREPNTLTLPQAALLAAKLGDARPDPWCEPEAATAARNRVLARMRDNAAIAVAEFQQATAAPLALAPPPEGRPPCWK